LLGGSMCRMFNHAVAPKLSPKHVGTDDALLFRFHHWLANLRILEIEEVKLVPYTPDSHPIIERLIETTRGEYLDRVFFGNSVAFISLAGATQFSTTRSERR
jgi:hypothetical protein